MIVTDESKIATYDGGIIKVQVYRNEDSHSRTANGIRCTLTHNDSPPKVLDIALEEFLHATVLAYPNNEWVPISADSPECATLVFQLDGNTLKSLWELRFILPDDGSGLPTHERRMCYDYYSTRDMVLGLYNHFPSLWNS